MFMAVGLFAAAIAQTRPISGKVVDKDGKAISGASVSLKGHTGGVAANSDGSFTINAKTGDVLVISSIGYTSIQSKVSTGNSISVTLASKEVAIDEVIVTAMGIKRKKNELPFAAQQVGGDVVSKTRGSNFVNQLSGQVSGLQVTQTNSMGGSTNAIIRGYKSLTRSNQALFVVDGTPVDNSNTNSTDTKTGRGGYDFGNASADINPDQIESISVLKGAAATALYGERAANGAIVIVTKKGKKGLGVTVNTGITKSSVDKSTLPKYQKQYGAGYGSAYGYGSPDGNFLYFDANGDGTNDLVVPTTEDASWGAKFDPTLKVYQWDAFDKTNKNYGKATPWVAAPHDISEFFEKPLSFNNSVTVSGGDDVATFFLGYTRSNEKGIMPNSSLNKDLLNFSSSRKVTDKLSVTASINYSQINGLGREATGYGGGAPNPMSSFRQWWEVNNDILDQKEAYFRTKKNTTWNWSDVTSPKTGLTPIFWDNPYWDRYENYETDSRKRYFGNVAINYNPFSWLNIVGKVSMDAYNEIQEERNAIGSLPFQLTGTAGADPSGYSRYNRSFQETNYDLLANFEKKITHDLMFKGLLGTNIRQNSISTIQAGTNGGLTVDKLYSLSNSVNAPSAPLEGESKQQVEGVFGGATFTWKEMVILDGSLRRDHSSTLPKDVSSYNYPAVSAGFVFSKLPVFSDLINYGKLRLNYAEVGSSADVQKTKNTYIVNDPYGGAQQSEVRGGANNANLVPERTKSYEAGLEVSLLKNRLSFDVSYYQARTINEIFNVEISRATGRDSKVVNAGEVKNTGVELTVTGVPVKTKDFSWEVKLNWTKNKNEVVSLFSDSAVLQLGNFQGGVSLNATPGHAYGEIRGDDYVYYKNTGIPIVKSNGWYQKTSTSNNVIGNATPNWIGGINNTFRYKNFSLSFLIDMRQGGDIFSLDMYYGLATGLYPETAGLNDLGKPVRASLADGGGIINPGVTADGKANVTRKNIGTQFGAYGYARKPAKAFVYDASFVKLRNITLDYSLPSKFVNKLGFFNFKAIDVSVIARNVWIISKNMPYSDPEETFSSGNLQGYQGNSIPTTRTMGVNVKFTF